MKIEILGIGCPKCKQLTANAEAAVKKNKKTSYAACWLTRQYK